MISCISRVGELSPALLVRSVKLGLKVATLGGLALCLLPSINNGAGLGPCIGSSALNRCTELEVRVLNRSCDTSSSVSSGTTATLMGRGICEMRTTLDRLWPRLRLGGVEVDRVCMVPCGDHWNGF